MKVESNHLMSIEQYRAVLSIAMKFHLSYMMKKINLKIMIIFTVFKNNNSPRKSTNFVCRTRDANDSFRRSARLSI